MTTRPMQIDDFFKLKFISAAQLSPDGRRVVYAVLHVDLEEEKEYSTLWLVDLETQLTRQLTAGTATDSAPTWSPNGRQIAFLSTRGKDDKAQLYLIPVDGGEARQMTSFEQGVGGAPVWSPDGTMLAFSVGLPKDDVPDLEKPYRVTRHVYRFDGIGYLDNAVQDIYVFDANGGEPQRLTEDETINTNLKWSPDGSTILYHAMMLPDIHNTIFPRLRTVSLGGEVHEIIGEWGSVAAADWLPDSQHIVFGGQPTDGRPIGSKDDIWLTDIHGAEPACRTGGLSVGVDGGLSAWMPGRDIRNNRHFTIPDGTAVYAPVQDGGTLHIYRVALHGDESWEAVVTGNAAHYLLDLQAETGQLLYAATSFNQPPDLYIAESDGSNERQITTINDDLLAEIALPNVERLQFKGVDGAEVEGWAYIPQNGDGPHPTILNIHGGPHGAYGSVFHFLAQVFVGAGYAVVMLNHRASTGYGDDFSTAIKGDWGNLDYHDLMTGVDYAIDRGIADPKRMGVTGVSGGGNLSCWIVGQTGRFKAAAPHNPLTNWLSFYGVSDIGVWFGVEELGGHPHEIPDVYVRCSPITYAHRCTTPTLMIQGEHDHRCPPEQSEQFYAVLKANGCPVEMLRLPKSPHGGVISGDPINRRVYLESVLEWMNRYVLNGDVG